MDKCILCAGTLNHLIYSDERLSVLKCRTCGLVRQSNYEEALAKLKPEIGDEEFYESAHRPATEVNLLKTLRTADIQNKIANVFRPATPVLDVGCGNGEFMRALSQVGVVSIGVEPNPQKAAVAMEQLGLNVRASLYQKALFPPESFDVITFIQVLEHVVDPLDALEIAFFHLQPGGYVVIDVPGYHNPRILLFRALKWNRLGKRDFIPTHNFYYTRDTLSEIASRCGFTLLEAITGRYKVKYGYRNKLFKSALGPVDFVANLLGIGGITLYAQKVETTLMNHSEESVQA